MERLLKQFMKFAGVGLVAFVIDFGIMTFLTEVFHINYLVSTTTGFIVSTLFNYLASMRFVFQHKEELSRRREFVIFMILSVVGLGLNDLLMFIGVDFAMLDYRFMKIVATFVVTFYNFVSRKLFLDAESKVVL